MIITTRDEFLRLANAMMVGRVAAPVRNIPTSYPCDVSFEWVHGALVTHDHTRRQNADSIFK